MVNDRESYVLGALVTILNSGVVQAAIKVIIVFGLIEQLIYKTPSTKRTIVKNFTVAARLIFRFFKPLRLLRPLSVCKTSKRFSFG